MEPDILTPEILKERAIQYAQPQESAEKNKSFQEFMAFRLGEEWFLIEMKYLHEIHPERELSQMPRQKPVLLGVTNIRGQIVMVLNLAQIMMLDSVSDGQKEKRQLILVNLENLLTGLRVDEVSQTLHLDPSEAQQNLASLNECEAALIKGFFQEKGRSYCWLNLEQILSELGEDLKMNHES